MGSQEKLIVEGRHLLLVFGWVPLGKEPAIFASPGACLLLGPCRLCSFRVGFPGQPLSPCRRETSCLWNLA